MYKVIKEFVSVHKNAYNLMIVLKIYENIIESTVIRKSEVGTHDFYIAHTGKS